MKLIAAVDKNWAIGSKGQLLVSIPQDQKNVPERDYGKSHCHGTKNPGRHAGRAAALWPDQHCAFR